MGASQSNESLVQPATVRAPLVSNAANSTTEFIDPRSPGCSRTPLAADSKPLYSAQNRSEPSIAEVVLPAKAVEVPSTPEKIPFDPRSPGLARTPLAPAKENQTDSEDEPKPKKSKAKRRLDIA